MTAELPEATARVYLPFLRLLQSPERLEIPEDTLFGAITHFLSVLPSSQLETFTQALVTSRSLWSKPEASTAQGGTALKFTAAVSYAVGGKAANLRQELSGLYFPSRRIRRGLQEWLLSIMKSVTQTTDSVCYSHHCLIAGLLGGVDEEKEVDWGNAREELELELATIVDHATSTGEEISDILWGAVPLLQDAKLRVLDVNAIASQLLVTVTSSLPSLASIEATPNSSRVAIYCKGVAKLIKASAAGSARDRERSCRMSTSFLQIMSEATTAGEIEWVKEGSQHSNTERHKTLLFSALLPSLAILDHTLLTWERPPAELAVEILQLLANMSYLTAEATSGMEGWDRLFYGCLDVVSASKVRVNVKDMAQGPSGDSRAAFVMVVAEQLLPHIDVQAVLRLSEEYLARPDTRPAFEAAHALMLALLRAASESRSSSQDAFSKEIVHFYGELVLQQAATNDLTSDQTRAAYAEVVKTAAAVSIDDASACISSLEAAYKSRPDQILRLTRVSIIPYVPAVLLESYLNDLAEVIVTSSDADRTTLSHIVFRTIVEELGHEGKVIGMKWWLDWRDRFGIVPIRQSKSSL